MDSQRSKIEAMRAEGRDEFDVRNVNCSPRLQHDAEPPSELLSSAGSNSRSLMRLRESSRTLFVASKKQLTT